MKFKGSVCLRCDLLKFEYLCSMSNNLFMLFSDYYQL